MSLVIKKADSNYLYALCVYLRTIVFVQEQACPLPEEFDELENESVSYVGFLNDEPVATARYRIINGDTGKIERILVLDRCRGQGCAKAITQYVIDDLQKNPTVKKLKLSAQDHAIPLYERLGFEVTGDGYIEAGIPHHMMERVA